MNLIVQKFGGTSVANAERVRHVAQIITDTYEKGNAVIAVVSAQGDTTDDLIAKAAEISDKPSSREMDVLLSTGEQISMSLLAMAIEKLGYPVISLTGWQAGFLTMNPPIKMPASRRSTPSVCKTSWTRKISLLLQDSRESTATTISPHSDAVEAIPVR